MKGKQNGGFTLVEVLVAMAILTSIVIPVCSSLVLSTRIDAKAEAVLQARLAVSSALETMMAEGIDKERIDERFKHGNYDLDGDDQEEALYIKVIKVGNENDTPYYNVEVSDPNGLVTMTTCIREAITNPENSGEQEGGGGQ